MTRQTTIALAVATLFVTACGGSSPDAAATTPPAGQTVVVTTAPAEADVAPGATFQFSAQVSGTTFTAVNWTVEEAGGGSIDTAGVYTAPATEGTYHVRADSAIASVTSHGKSIVRVKKGAVAPVVVAVSPTTATVLPGGSHAFAAAVTGTTNLAVTWTVQEGTGCGSVSAAGLYTAPNVASTCHVVATSQADTTKSGSAAVTVTAAPVIAVSVTPATASVLTGGTVTFAAAVTGTTAGQSTAATWSVPAGSGTINASTGVYVAPANPGTYVVTATSVADGTKRGTATVTVTAAPVIAVSVTPATASLLTGGTVTFAATVTGTTAGQSTAATWSVPAGSGTINASTGVYVAPATAGTYVVTATSVADGTKRGTATVTVTPAPVIAVSVTPATASVLTGGTVTFAATVTGTTAGQSTAATWSVPAGSGTINASTGVYVAPATAGTYVVTATSVADGTKRGTATVTVTAPPVTIAIAPITATLDACRGQVFTATVGNSSNPAVTWFVTEAGGGTVTNGAYTAPSVAGTYHVVAVSQADASKTATATVTVGDERVLSVAVVPGSGTVQANGQILFAANVTTTCGTFAAQ